MTDSEKICLIGEMIGDFFEFLTEEQQMKNSMGLIIALGSVAGFERKD